jgi:hypothetical protein
MKMLLLAAAFFVHTLADPVSYCHTQVDTSDPLYSVAELACEALDEVACGAKAKTAEECEYGPGPEFCHTQVNPGDSIYPAAAAMCGALLSGTACSTQRGISNCTWGTAVDVATVNTWGALASAIMSMRFKTGSFTLSAGFTMAGYKADRDGDYCIGIYHAISIASASGGAVLDAGSKGGLFCVGGDLTLQGLTLKNGIGVLMRGESGMVWRWVYERSV